jgi:mono/diheme cytochrome c family protein
VHNPRIKEAIMSKPFAVLGLYDKPDDLIKGIRALRDTWGEKLEAYTPYPIHGIEKELRIKKSFVGKMVLLMGLSGLVLAFAFQSWAFMADYQIQFGGKPYFSWASFVPIIFEVTVLLAAVLGAVGGMLFIANKLPHYSHPILSSEAIKGITRDKLALAIHLAEGDDSEKAKADLQAAQAEMIETVEQGAPMGSNPLFTAKLILTTLLLCVVMGYGTWHLMRAWPKLPLVAALDEQDKVLPFRDFNVLDEGRSMRQAPLGTIPRGTSPATFQTLDEADQWLANPLPVTEEVLLEGRRVYETHCLVCHGQLGDGKKLLSDEYKATPTNLHSSVIKQASDGYLFGVISLGKNAMASYSKDISPDERWSLVHYLRALQRSQDASQADFELARNLEDAR